MTQIEPLDRTHAECLAARDAIRAHVATIRTQISTWQPKPCPPPTRTPKAWSTK